MTKQFWDFNRVNFFGVHEVQLLIITLIVIIIAPRLMIFFCLGTFIVVSICQLKCMNLPGCFDKRSNFVALQ